MKELICARAAVTLALSLCLNMRGATSAANSAMMVTTTSISIKVIPALPLFLRLFISHRHFIYARDRQQHAQNQRTYHYAHHQNYQRLEQRGEAFDGRAGVGLVDFGHAGEHLIEPARFLAHH